MGQAREWADVFGPYALRLFYGIQLALLFFVSLLSHSTIRSVSFHSTVVHSLLQGGAGRGMAGWWGGWDG